MNKLTSKSYSKNENYINVSIFETIVLKMRTIINQTYEKIFECFYANQNKSIHLRELSRQINLKEGPLSRHLNTLLKDKILIFEKEGNLKKFKISKEKLPQIFSLFDLKKLNSLPPLRKNAIKTYIQNLPQMPVFVILFGSTAKETFTQKSDIDILLVTNTKINPKNSEEEVCALTSMNISTFQITYKEFIEELKMKRDHVIQSAIFSGYPVYNQNYYYEVLNNERI